MQPNLIKLYLDAKDHILMQLSQTNRNFLKPSYNVHTQSNPKSYSTIPNMLVEIYTKTIEQNKS